MIEHHFPVTLLPVEDEGYHVLFRNVKAEHLIINMLIDTGASQTVLDYHFFRDTLKHQKEEKNSTGLGSDTLESYKTFIPQLRFEDFLIEDFPCMLIDLTHLINTYDRLRLPAIQGVIGSDLLVRYKATIDFENQRLTLKT